MTYEYVVGGFAPDVTPQEQQTKFNQLGAEGWELVSAAFVPAIARAPNYLMFYFKRPKFETEEELRRELVARGVLTP